MLTFHRAAAGQRRLAFVMDSEIKKPVRMEPWAGEQVSLLPEVLTPELLVAHV